MNVNRSHFKIFLAAALFLTVLFAFGSAEAKKNVQPSSALTVAAVPANAAASFTARTSIPELSKEYWGISEVPFNESRDLFVFITRDKAIVRQLSAEKFTDVAPCEWKSDAQAARVYSYLPDGALPLIVVTGVDDGQPSSFIFEFDGTKCTLKHKTQNWSLRADASEGLLAQWWSSQDYFSGPVVKMNLENNALKRTGELTTPARTKIYLFEMLPDNDQVNEIIMSRGRDYLGLFRREENKFKRIWRSAQKFGGTINQLEAESRDLLDEAKSEFASFDIPPVSISLGGTTYLMAVRQDMPVAQGIGRTPYIKGSEIVVFKRDRAFEMIEVARTPMISGAIVDFTVDKKGPNDAEILALTREDTGFFDKGVGSRTFVFDLHTN